MELLNKIKLPEFAQEFIDELFLKGRKNTTIRRYAYDLQDFLEWFGKEPMKVTENQWLSLNYDDYERYLVMLEKDRNYKARTLKRILSVLKQFNKFHGTKGKQVVDLTGITFEFEDKLGPGDFITEEELNKLIESTLSLDNLEREEVVEAYKYLSGRNASIIILLGKYGLAMNELANIDMKHVNFYKRTIEIYSDWKLKRTLVLSEGDNEILRDNYFNNIIERKRPSYHSSDPLFVAFNFKYKEYHWSYEDNKPKRISVVSIQKMIRRELKRAGLRSGLSANHMRNTVILNAIQQLEEECEEHLKTLNTAEKMVEIQYGRYRINKEEELIKKFGLKVRKSLKRYKKTLSSVEL